MQLRPYQERLINDARKALKTHKRVLLQAPTGAGKTAITVHMMKTAASRGLTSMFIVHQNELLSQTSRALWEQRLEHGMIAGGKTKSLVPSQVASVQTLVRRLDQYDEPKLIIIDECHRASASTYRKVLEAYPDSKVIGLTATPRRTDGKGLSDIFDTIVQGPTIRQLINAEYLCDYELMAPPAMIDVSHIRNLDAVNTQEVEAAVDKPSITGNAVDHYVKHASGRRCVVMCVSLAHSKHVMEEYQAAGIPSEEIHGGMSNKEREAILNRLKSGETLVLCNVQLLIEGVDVPEIEVIQWLRPTQSLIVWMQGNGRGLRPKNDGGRLLILDHVGNFSRPGFGFPDDDRTWSLEGRKKGRKKASDDEPDIGIQQCKKCFAVFRSGVDTCPSCGAPVERMTARGIEVVEGELEKIEVIREKKEKRREQGKAGTLEDLVALGHRKGYKSGWALNVFAARRGRKPTIEEKQSARVVLDELRGGEE